MKPYALMILAALPLAAPGSVRAGQITNVQLYDGFSASPVVTIVYSNADGTGTNSTMTFADPQVSYGTTAPLFYCIDPWHENNLGDTYTITPVAGIAFPTSSYNDVDNRIGWLLAQDQSTVDARAAVQLAIWYTIDNNPAPGGSAFSMTTSDPVLQADYNNLISFAGYNPSTTYSADFWQATHDPSNTLYQNMVSAGGGFTALAVPEPAGLVQAAIGLLLPLAYIPLLRRRRRRSRGSPGAAR